MTKQGVIRGEAGRCCHDKRCNTRHDRRVLGAQPILSFDQEWSFCSNTPVMFRGVECRSMTTNLNIRLGLPAARRCFADGLRIGGAMPNYVEHRTGPRVQLSS